MTEAPQEILDFFARIPGVDGDALARRCSHLYDLLTEANSQFNLTRIDSEAGFWSKHVADSLSLAVLFPQLCDKSLQIADVGCGAGFPSLILAMAFPAWRICAIDSIGKKTRFVAEAGETLGLKNLEVVTGRSRELDYKEEFQNRFDLVTARAVAPTPTLARDARRFIKRDKGHFLFYKTPQQLTEEWETLTTDPKLKQLGWRRTEPFALPLDAGMRQFVYSGKL